MIELTLAHSSHENYPAQLYIRRACIPTSQETQWSRAAHQLRSAMSRPPRLGTALATGRSAVAEPRSAMSRPAAGRAPATS